MNNLVIGAFIAFATLLSVANHVIEAGPVDVVSLESEWTNTRRKREVYPEISDEPEKFDDAQAQVCVVGDLVYEQNEAVPADQPCLKCKCQPPGVHCEATRCEKKPGCRAIHKPNTCCPEYQCECEFEGKSYTNGERLVQKPGTECKVCYCRGGEVQCAEVSCYIRNDCEGHKVPGKCCPKYDHCPPREPSSSYYANEIAEMNKSKSDDVTAERRKPDSTIETPKITIQEIIPEIKEIPITSSPKREINPVAQGQQASTEEPSSGSPAAISNTSNELDAFDDTESDSSEVAEVYQQPPPVLRIGDKLLFLKKGELIPEKDASTPATVITIIGAEGLQRGFEDSLETQDQANRTESNKEVPDIHQEDATGDSNEEDMQTVAESTYILSLVKRQSTTESQSEMSREETTEDPNLAVNSTDLLLAFADDFDIDFADNSTVDMKSMLSSTTEPAASTISSKLPSVPTSDAPLSSVGEKDEIIESNPEYPPLPDVMTQQVEEAEHPPQNADGAVGGGGVQLAHIQPKILTEVFAHRNSSSNTTEPSTGNDGGGNNTDWLKKTLLNPAATLPDSILDSVAESDATNPPETTSITPTQSPAASESPTESSSTSSSTPRSIETMESIETTDESGENVTQTNDHASILNDDSNASVEDMTSSSSTPTTDGDDVELVEMLPGYENSTDGAELATQPPPTPATKNAEDVEMIDVDLMRGHTDKEARNVTHEGDEKMGKNKKKRASSEDDAIFEELNREIGLDAGTLIEEKPQAEEDAEAKAIFKELVDEASSNTTPKPVNLQGEEPQTAAQRTQAAALARIGDALSKFQLRDSKKSGGIDGNVLGILRDFFTAQYRAYN